MLGLKTPVNLDESSEAAKPSKLFYFNQFEHFLLSISILNAPWLRYGNATILLSNKFLNKIRITACISYLAGIFMTKSDDKGQTWH